VVAAIEQYLRATPPGDCPLRILTLLPDRGERYLDTIYDDAWLERIAARRAGPSHTSRSTDYPLAQVGEPA
jgi:cysteine synthase A